MFRFPRPVVPTLAILASVILCLPAILCLSAILCLPAVAQQQPGEGKGPSKSTAGRVDRGVNVLTVVTSKSVQKILKIRDEQNARFQEIAEERQEAMRKMFLEFAKLKDKSQEERKAEMDKWMKEAPAAGEELRKQVAGVLSEEQNRKLGKIFAQILLQTQGPSALVQKQVAEVVGLSQEQRRTIQAIVDDSRQEMKKLFGKAGEGLEESRAELRKKIGELRQKTTEKTREVLSEEQRANVKELIEAARIELDFRRPSGAGTQPSRPER